MLMIGIPSNQAFVQGAGKAAKALRDGPGFAPTPPLPSPAPFPVDLPRPGVETLPTDEEASKPDIPSAPRTPELPTMTAGDEFDAQQAVIMEASRNAGLAPELRAYAERARGIVRVSDRGIIKKAGLTEAEWRAHHLIPHEAVRLNIRLFQAAARAGYRIDNPGNLVALPLNETAQEKMRAAGQSRPIHDSGHKG